MQVDTVAYLSFRPNPIGVGQTLLVNMWVTPGIHRTRYLSGYEVTFTKPDGTEDVVGPMDSYLGDCTAWFEYVVDQEGIWNITMGGWMAMVTAIADGILLGANTYDGYIYAFGKGPTAIEVSAPQTTVASGSTVLIQGTVLDQSPAQPGTPCVSKESMATYMEYLHMQKPIPDGYVVTGVPVMLLACDSSGNVIEIDTVTSDLGGFRHEWTPPDEGLYTITATFMGDDSYGSSWAATGLSVGPAPEPAPEYGSPEWPADPEAPAYTTIDLVLVAVAVVTICLVLYTLWTVRKLRK